MDTEMASWRSTGTYIDTVPPSRSITVDGMWIFRVKRPPGSPPAFKARYVARGFSQRQGVDYFQTFSPTPKITTLRVLLHVAAQRDYELHYLEFSTAFLQGSLHEEIWLRRPPGFTGSFPAGTQWSLWRPVYDLRQAPREWHNTLRTILVALGFTPSTADPLLLLRTDTLLPPFYVLVYVDDLVFATANNEALTLVKSELQKRHTCTDLVELCSYLGLQITRDRARRTITLTQSHMVHQVLQRFGFQFSSQEPTPLSTSHSLSAPPSDESVEPSGPYQELVGCLIMSGMGLVLGGWGPVVLIGHADASWVDDSATQRSSSCEAEIYAGAMAAQELRWLTYLLTDLGATLAHLPIRDDLVDLGYGRRRRRLEFLTYHVYLPPAAFTTLYDNEDDDLAYDDAEDVIELPELDPDMHADPEHCRDIAMMTAKEALESWKGKAVKAAMDEGIRSLICMGTWELVERSRRVNILKNQWLLMTKYHINDTVAREKARLVVKGFTQVYGADYDERYAPMSSYVMLRIFLNIVAVLNLNLMQLNMKNAFLQSKLDQVLYMYQPDYYNDGTGRERQEEEYRQKVSSLQFAPTTMRPDIAFACSKLGSGLTVRSNQHWREVDCCLTYLANTHDTALEFGGGPESLKLVGYVDADDSGDKQNRTSTRGYVFVYGGAAVS
ncbi:unnamed protein product [Closterium sp. NIES-53]